jgi:hypothetical protein
MATASSSSEEETKVRVHIVFDYTIEPVPTKRKAASIVQRHLDFNVHLDILPKSLDERGYPDPRAMWFAERQLIKALEEKHTPEVRLIAWRSHLKGDPFVLSEFAVHLSSSGL